MSKRAETSVSAAQAAQSGGGACADSSPSGSPIPGGGGDRGGGAPPSSEENDGLRLLCSVAEFPGGAMEEPEARALKKRIQREEAARLGRKAKKIKNPSRAKASKVASANITSGAARAKIMAAEAMLRAASENPSNITTKLFNVSTISIATKAAESKPKSTKPNEFKPKASMNDGKYEATDLTSAVQAKPKAMEKVAGYRTEGVLRRPDSTQDSTKIMEAKSATAPNRPGAEPKLPLEGLGTEANPAAALVRLGARPKPKLPTKKNPAKAAMWPRKHPAPKSPATATIGAKQSKKGPYSTRPYNRYNIYFIYERERIVRSKSGETAPPPRHESEGEGNEKSDGAYDDLVFPPLPARYAHLSDLPTKILVAGREKKRRPHRKTHGVASFKGLAREIATSWKTVDKETLDWCTEVEQILKVKQRQLALAAAKSVVKSNASLGRHIELEQRKQLQLSTEGALFALEAAEAAREKHGRTEAAATADGAVPLRKLPGAIAGQHAAHVFATKQKPPQLPPGCEVSARSSHAGAPSPPNRNLDVSSNPRVKNGGPGAVSTLVRDLRALADATLDRDLKAIVDDARRLQAAGAPQPSPAVAGRAHAAASWHEAEPAAGAPQPPPPVAGRAHATASWHEARSGGAEVLPLGASAASAQITRDFLANAATAAGRDRAPVASNGTSHTPGVEVLLDLIGGVRGGAGITMTSDLKSLLSKPLSEVSLADLLSHIVAPGGKINSAAAAAARARAPTSEGDARTSETGAPLDLIGRARGGAKNSLGSDLKSLLSKPLSEAQIANLRSYLSLDIRQPASSNVGAFAPSGYPRDERNVLSDRAATAGEVCASATSNGSPGMDALLERIRSMRGNDLQAVIGACRTAAEASQSSASAAIHARAGASPYGDLHPSRNITRDFLLGSTAAGRVNAAGRSANGSLPPGVDALLDLIGHARVGAGNISTSEGHFNATEATHCDMLASYATGASRQTNAATAAPTNLNAVQHHAHSQRDSMAAKILSSRTADIDTKFLELLSSRRDQSHQVGVDAAGNERPDSLLHLLDQEMRAAYPHRPLGSGYQSPDAPLSANTVDHRNSRDDKPPSEY
ncbi:hypothetical protein ACHAWF_007161 [Thalassiosira exigua]